MKRAFSLVLFTFLFVVLFACAHRQTTPMSESAAADQTDPTDIVADYNCRIIGDYRLNRSSARHQSIYYSSSAGTNIRTLVKGTIEKYMHDGERFIAYRLSDPDVQDSEAYYAILDTQTEETERFDSAEAFSAAVQDRGIRFGNWFYPAAGHSIEGVRTPLFGAYTFENISSVRGQSVLRREIPLFHGILSDVVWDDGQFITFRQRITRDRSDYLEFKEDAITNRLLSAPSDKRIGVYRGGFLNWSSVYYDRYVLFDTHAEQITEFENKKELRSFCEANGIQLTNRMPER